MQNRVTESVPSNTPRQHREFVPVWHPGSNRIEMVERYPTPVTDNTKKLTVNLRYIFAYQ